MVDRKILIRMSEEEETHLMTLTTTLMLLLGRQDSGVLNLVWEVVQERGQNHHRDEEFNPVSRDNIKHYFDKDWCNMTWYYVQEAAQCLFLVNQ